MTGGETVPAQKLVYQLIQTNQDIFTTPKTIIRIDSPANPAHGVQIGDFAAPGIKISKSSAWNRYPGAGPSRTNTVILASHGWCLQI